MGLFGKSVRDQLDQLIKQVSQLERRLPPQPDEDDPMRVLAMRMAEDSRNAAAELAEASAELANERRLLQAHQRRQEAESLRQQRQGQGQQKP